ncbi:DUF5784 family protein [Halocalculus aciditolerans]|uniref:DUF5784 family protein n=1 Tax=Halocalculus aciditolerans TaxID=1383812 RepID=UPI0016675E43|nr:DUF5784 family protein [Halocalculus aciditolerans]
MARPLRFRHSTESWSDGRVRSQLLSSLDSNIGAEMSTPWFKPPGGYTARRFDMANGDVALFAWRDDDAYWMGNTETPKALWRTEKYGFEEVPWKLSRWVTRELTAQLHEETPWLEPYPYVSWFFLPVFLSKDGRETTRNFFDEHAGGFPDASRDDALGFYEDFLSSGALDDHRHVMAGKLGTSEYLDHQRMSAAMGEFNAARLLHDAGYDLTPEIPVDTGHSLDYAVEHGGRDVLVEVTRPTPPSRRRASTPVAAVKETAASKATGQLKEHGGVVLLVDCSSFFADDWRQVRGETPGVRHRPAAVYRTRPDGSVDGYTVGDVPLDLPFS